MGVMYAKGLGVEVDYHKAFEFYMKSALRNYAQAQNNVAFCYVSGQGVKKDYSKAMEWYLKAAQQNHAEAQNNIGVMYEKAEGIPQDYAQAMTWYLKAASNGNANAKKILEIFITMGKECRKIMQKLWSGMKALKTLIFTYQSDKPPHAVCLDGYSFSY